MHAYRLCGLAVESAIPLPGLAACMGGAADVAILRGDVPFELPGAERHPTYQLAGERFLLRIPRIARFLLEGGNRITVALEENAGDADAAIFILDTVFGILLHQRGDFVLHASAARVGDRAVLFAGPSGAGKSTVAAALAKRGHALIADDICAISSGRVLSDGRRLKLWANAIDRLDLASTRGDPVRDTLKKFYVEPAAADETPLPVGAVYVLRETRPPSGDGIETANIVDATLLLRRSVYRQRLVKMLGQDNFYLQSAATLVAKAGVFVFRRPIDFRAMDEGLDRLESHWRGLGFLGARP